MVGLLPSTQAKAEFVVPRSMPIILLMMMKVNYEV
jgi:hypothetical protein